MKVVNKWNRCLLRAVRRSGNSSIANVTASGHGDDHSVGSNEEDVRITDGRLGTFTSYLPRRSREKRRCELVGKDQRSALLAFGMVIFSPRECLYDSNARICLPELILQLCGVFCVRVLFLSLGVFSLA